MQINIRSLITIWIELKISNDAHSMQSSVRFISRFRLLVFFSLRHLHNRFCVRNSTAKGCVLFHFIELLLCLHEIFHDKKQTSETATENWRQIWFAWERAEQCSMGCESAILSLYVWWARNLSVSSSILGMHKTVIFHINNRQQRQSNHDSCVSRGLRNTR